MRKKSKSALSRLRRRNQNALTFIDNLKITKDYRRHYMFKILFRQGHKYWNSTTLVVPKENSADMLRGKIIGK